MQDQTKAGMLCPVCRVDLMMSDRQGIEIDYCPKCRGVWLDRGELDKIVERSASFEAPAQPAAAPYREPERRMPDYRHGDDDYRYHGRKRKSFLSDLFD